MTSPQAATRASGLTPSRALWIFIVSLGGSIALLIRTDVAWHSVLPVAFYGALLWLLQLPKASREYTSTVKDSPYFLGFILTLLGLFKIFVGIGAQPRNAAGVIDVSQLVAQAGGAILATVVGLFFRQVLWSHDKFENQRESTYQELTASLRDNAVEYHTQQQALVNLVADFADSRQRLLAKEEAVHTRYLEYLEQTNTVLDDFNTQYPAKVGAVIDGLNQAGETITRAAAAFGVSVSTASEDLAKTFSSQAAKFVESVTAATTPINQAGRELATSVVEFDSVLDAGGKKIATSLEHFAATVGETPASLKETAASLQSLRENSKGLEESILRVIASGNSIQLAIDELVKGLAADTDSIHADIKRRATVLAADMKDVDMAFDELLALMRRRLLSGDIRLRTDGGEPPVQHG